MLAGDIAIFLGDYSSARDDLNEAARRLLPHAEAEPGDVEVQRKLAETYERRGDAEMGLGEAERAFDTYWEALDIHGDLPHGQGGRNDLAVGRSAMKAGRALSMAGNPTPALRYLTRAERYLRDRFEADPQRAALRLALAQTLAGQAMAHGRGLELGEAEARARETLDMLAPLIAQTPGDTAARHIRFEALYELASVLWFLERHDEMQEVIKAAREEMELLREANPTHAGWIFDTVRLEMRAAHYATRMGDGAGALERLLEARGYADILINQGGDNRRWRQLHLELNLDIQTEQRFAQTEAELTDLLLTRTHIVLGRMWFLSQDPEDATSAMQLGEAYLRLGQTQLALSDPAKADESLRDAYDWLTSASARVGVSRPEFQAAEAAATLGLLELNYGSVENAVAWHRIALDLRVALHQEVPGDRHRRWLLSVSREQLGNALATQEGGLEAGIVEHEIARDMRLNLLEEVPTDWAVTWGLFVSYFQLADFGADPAANFARALAVLERMERAERLSPGQAEYLAVTRERIAEIGQQNQEDEAPAKTP